VCVPSLCAPWHSRRILGGYESLGQRAPSELDTTLLGNSTSFPHDGAALDASSQLIAACCASVNHPVHGGDAAECPISAAAIVAPGEADAALASMALQLGPALVARGFDFIIAGNDSDSFLPINLACEESGLLQYHVCIGLACRCLLACNCCQV
jgi:hypothetical protein